MEDLFELNKNGNNTYNDFMNLINMDLEKNESSSEEKLFLTYDISNNLLTHKKGKYVRLIKQICNRNDLKYFNYYINNYEKIKNIKGLKVKGESKVCVLILCMNFIYCNLNNEIMTIQELKHQLKENISKGKIYCKSLAKIIFEICKKLNIKNFINCSILPFMEKYITNIINRIKNVNTIGKKNSKIEKNINIFDDIFDFINNCSNDNDGPSKEKYKDANEEHYEKINEKSELKHINNPNNKMKENIKLDIHSGESSDRKKYKTTIIPENENLYINKIEIEEEIKNEEEFLYNYSYLHSEDINCKDAQKTSEFDNYKIETFYKNNSDYIKDEERNTDEISNNYFQDNIEFNIFDYKNLAKSNYEEHSEENMKYEKKNIDRISNNIAKDDNEKAEIIKQNIEKKIVEYLEKNVTLLSLYSCVLYSFFVLWDSRENMDMNVYSNINRFSGSNLHYFICSFIILTFNIFNIKIKDQFICYCLNIPQHSITIKKKEILNFFFNTINEFLGVNNNSHKKTLLYMRVIFSNYILLQMYLFYIIKKHKLMNKNNFMNSLKQIQIYMAKFFSIVKKKFLNLSDIIVDYNFLFRSECVYKNIQQIISQNHDFMQVKKLIRNLIKDYLTEEEKQNFYEYNFNESYDIDLNNINSYIPKLLSYVLLNSEDINFKDSQQSPNKNGYLKIKNIPYEETSNIPNINVSEEKTIPISFLINVNINTSYSHNYNKDDHIDNNNISYSKNIDNNSFNYNSNNNVNNNYDHIINDFYGDYNNNNGDNNNNNYENNDANNNNISDRKSLSCYDELNKNGNLKSLGNIFNLTSQNSLINFLKDMNHIGACNLVNSLKKFETLEDEDIPLDIFNYIDVLKKINLSTINEVNMEIVRYYNIKVVVQFLFFNILKSIIYNCYSLSFFSLSNLHRSINFRKNSKNILWEYKEQIEDINMFIKKKIARKLKENKSKKCNLEKYFFCEQIFYIENFQNAKLYNMNLWEFLNDKKIILHNIPKLINNDSKDKTNKTNDIQNLGDLPYISNSNENNYFIYSDKNDRCNCNCKKEEERKEYEKDLIKMEDSQKGNNKKKIKTILYHYDVLQENFNEYNCLNKESFSLFDNIYNIKMMKEYKGLETVIPKNYNFLFNIFNNMNYSFGCKKKKLIKMNNCLYHTYHLIGIRKISGIGYHFTFKNELNDNYSKVLKTRFSNILSLEDVNFLFNRFFYFLFIYIKNVCCFSKKNEKEYNSDEKGINTLNLCTCNKINCCYKIKTIVILENF